MLAAENTRRDTPPNHQTISKFLCSQLSASPAARLAIRCLLASIPCMEAPYASQPRRGKNNRRSRFSTVSIVSSRVSKVRPRKAYWKPGKVCPCLEKPPHSSGSPVCVLKPQRVNATALRHWVDGPAGVVDWGNGPDRPSAPAGASQPIFFLLVPPSESRPIHDAGHCHDIIEWWETPVNYNQQGAHARYILETCASTRQRDMDASVSPPPQER